MINYIHYDFFQNIMLSLFLILFIFIFLTMFMNKFIMFVNKLFNKYFKYDIIGANSKKLSNTVKYIVLTFSIFTISNHFLFKYMDSFSTTLFYKYVLITYRIIIISLFTNIFYIIVPNIIEKLILKNESKNELLAKFTSNIVKILILSTFFIIILTEFGINVTALVTGLGLGGLTFALAAKDTASNIFGGIIIITDKQFDVGDWIQVDSVEGIVENINFRSTRIRTFDDSLSIFPNNTLANSIVTNWSQMNKRKLSFSFGIKYSTKSSDIKNIISELKYFAQNHPDIDSSSVIITLDDLSDSSINIFFRAFSYKISFAEIKSLKEELNYEIISILDRNDSSFAFPSVSIYKEI